MSLNPLDSKPSVNQIFLRAKVNIKVNRASIQELFSCQASWKIPACDLEISFEFGPVDSVLTLCAKEEFLCAILPEEDSDFELKQKKGKKRQRKEEKKIRHPRHPSIHKRKKRKKGKKRKEKERKKEEKRKGKGGRGTCDPYLLPVILSASVSPGCGWLGFPIPLPPRHKSAVFYIPTGAAQHPPLVVQPVGWSVEF